MAEHVLKCNAEYYDAIVDGRKNFEVRRDDRGFQCGDVLVLQRYVLGWTGSRSVELAKHDHYHAVQLRRRITYVLTGGQFGIEPGYVVMGLTDG